MKQLTLSVEEVLKGYDAVWPLYPYVPPMNLWRAWEYIAYKRYVLPEPMLDIGCGDGGFFRLIWPDIKKVVGVDREPAVVKAAEQSGIYSQVYLTEAHQLAVPPESFASAFANCSLEHMSHLPEVLKIIYHSLQPGGLFLFSVVTDKFIKWASLPLLIAEMGDQNWSQKLQDAHEIYHHLVNPLPNAEWVKQLEMTGFEVIDLISIMPELTSKLFLFLDNTWHVKNPRGEIGDALHGYLSKIPNFPQAFREIFSGILKMERDWNVGSGTVFLARKTK